MPFWRSLGYYSVLTHSILCFPNLRGHNIDKEFDDPKQGGPNTFCCPRCPPTTQFFLNDHMVQNLYQTTKSLEKKGLNISNIRSIEALNEERL